MKIYDFPDKEFKIIILQKLSEMQKNIDKQKIKLGKEYLNKMLMKFNKKENDKKEINQNLRAELNNDRIEQFNNEFQQHT